MFSHKNVGGLDSEHNSGCLETWDRLGEEAGTGRTRRSSSLSHHPAALALPKAGVPAQPRDPPDGRQEGGSQPAGSGQSSLAALCRRCHTRSVQQPLWEGAQASAEPGRLPAVLRPQAPAASPQPVPASPAPAGSPWPWGPRGAIAGASPHPCLHHSIWQGNLSTALITTTGRRGTALGPQPGHSWGKSSPAEPQERLFSMEGVWLGSQSPPPPSTTGATW